MKTLKTTLLLVLFTCVAFQAFAQDSLQVQSLDFGSLLREGFQNNYGLKLQDLSYRKAVYRTMSTEGLISPYFTADFTEGRGTDPTVSNDGTRQMQLGFVLPTRYGINVYAGGLYENSNMLNPSPYFLNSSGGWVGLQIPLLRGLGKNSQVNAAIRATQLSEQASKKQWSNQVLTYFRNILATYLTLVENVQQYKIHQDAMAEAVKYHSYIMTLISKDNLARAEQDKADELVIQQQELEASSELQEMNAYYDVQKLMGITRRIHSSQVPAILDSIPAPDISHIQAFIQKYTSLGDSIIKETPLYRNVELLGEASKVQMEEAKNQMLNNLKLDVRVSRFGISKAHNFNAPFNSPFPGNSLLFTLDYTLPLSNNEQKGSYLSSMADYESSRVSLHQLLFETHTSVQNSLSSLERLISLYQQNVKLVSIRQQTYMDEKNKFRFGDSSQIDVLISFNNYYQSKIDLITSEFDLYTNIVQIDYLLGILPTNQHELSRFSLDQYLLTY